MKIGLMIAVPEELEAFLRSGGNPEEEQSAGRTVYRTTMEGHEILAVCTGMGEIDASAGTMLLIAKYGCEIIMNFGVTGALEKDLKVEDLLVAEKVCHYDFDIAPLGQAEKCQYPEYPDKFIPLDAGLVRLARECEPAIRPAAVASGDKFVEEREEKNRLREMGCSICDMEIAGIARTCERSGVKCLSIKCISDTLDGNGRDFAENVRRGAERAFAVIRKILRALDA